MKFIITAQPSPTTTPASPDAPFNKDLFMAYMKFNEDLHKAGVLVASEGLNPGSAGARIELRRGKRVLVDGPFAESKELVGGFWVLDVGSLQEAVDWALKAPSGMGMDDVLEIRPLTGSSDLPPELVQLIREAAPTWSAQFEKKR